MNDLFEFNEDYDIIVNPRVMTLLPFKRVMDKYKDKRLGILELSFIHTLLSPKSEFSYIRDEVQRKEEVFSYLVDADKLKLDSITDQAIQFYKEHNYTTTSKYLDSNLDALDKLADYFSQINFTDRDSKNNLVYDPKKVVDTIKESPKLMRAIQELREAIKKEQEMEAGIRGSGQKGVYEDGNL